MFGLTTLGFFHTVVSILALVFGVVCIVREKFITSRTPLGMGYLLSMLVASVTAFGIFRTGAFSPGHALTILTLISLAIALGAERMNAFGARSAQIALYAYAFSFFTLLIFTVTEVLTRLPPGSPIAASQESPIVGAARLLALVFFVWQVRGIRSAEKK